MTDITTEQWKDALFSPQDAELVLEDLRAMRALLAPPGSWVQGAGARDGCGQALHPVASSAVGWCLWGAAVATAYKSGGTNSGDRAARVQEYLMLFTDDLRLSAWNDRKGRTQDQVQDFLDTAIEELEDLLEKGTK